ncbi:MAG: ABC transporter permease subunit [Clostridia bacterium]|nr:ABC transporter permease subunit [Clostridia bacterium]
MKYLSTQAIESKYFPNSSKTRLRELIRTLNKQKALIILSLPFFAFLIVFGYLPLWGWVMAFQDFKYGIPLFEQTWVGIEYFKQLLTDIDFYLAFRNTLVMSGLNLVFGTIASIVFALALNEVKNIAFKKTVQTISYLPYFVSWPIIANIVISMLAAEGTVNTLLESMGIIRNPILYLGVPNLFWLIAVLTLIWKYMGYGAIVYISAITSISPELYEAAEVDGAGRLRRIIHVTFPGILPVLKVMTIINIGYLLNSEYEMQYLLGNGLNAAYSQVIDTYVLKYGINLGRYSFATAAGVFKSVLALIMIFMANKAVKIMGEDKLF